MDEYKQLIHSITQLTWQKIFADKMDLIEEMRNKANGEGEAKWVCKKRLFNNCVKPSTSQEEIRRSVDFLKDI